MILRSLNGLQTIWTVEAMNLGILYFIKILQQNYSLCTISQNKRLVPPPPPPPTNNFYRVNEIQRFLWILVSVTLGAEFITFDQLFQRLLVMGGGGGGRGLHLHLAFYSVKSCVMINFSLNHNVLCFSFVVVCTSCIAYIQLLKWFSLRRLRSELLNPAQNQPFCG